MTTTSPAYPAARMVAPAIERHFAEHHALVTGHADAPLAPLPSADVAEALLNVAFWMSLRREEGRTPTLSMAFTPPEQAEHPLLFEHPLPFAPNGLTKLSPAVERPGIHLGVWYGRDGLCVWGATRTLPPCCFVVESMEPGLLVVKRRRGDAFSKFANVAVLRGDQVNVIDEAGSPLPDCPPVVDAMLGVALPNAWSNGEDVLVQLALSMRAHNRGGTLLVVPQASESWPASFVHPIPYAVRPAFAGLAVRVARSRSAEADYDALRRSVDGIAGLTAVDGATLINDRYALYAFGAKITRRSGYPLVEEVVVTEPVVGSTPRLVPSAQLGGTRHLSAAQFAHDQRDALALVASQDGRFTIFSWSPCEGRVHAHRVETLLM